MDLVDVIEPGGGVASEETRHPRREGGADHEPSVVADGHRPEPEQGVDVGDVVGGRDHRRSRREVRLGQLGVGAGQGQHDGIDTAQLVDIRRGHARRQRRRQAVGLGVIDVGHEDLDVAGGRPQLPSGAGADRPGADHTDTHLAPARADEIRDAV